jgi:methylmalonyl-CoA/ethylmalonyl-CoA epimerase
MTEKGLGSRIVTQIAIGVSDIEKAAEIYSRILGVEKPEIRITDEYDKAKTVYYGKPTPARVKMAFFNLGQVQLELMEAVDEPSVWKDVIDKQGGQGFHHIAFHVPDTDAALEFLAEQGMPMIQQGQYKGGQYTYVDSEPQLGIMLELLENFTDKK